MLIEFAAWVVWNLLALVGCGYVLRDLSLAGLNWICDRRYGE